MDLRILGPLEVLRGREQLSVPGHKARTLLACLVVNAGNTVSRDRLIDAIWGESPPNSAVNTLHTYVTHVRSALDQDRERASVVSTQPSGYRLEVPDDAVDARRFETALAEAQVHADRRQFRDAARLLDGALGEWRGPPLEEFRDAEFAHLEAIRLEELRLRAEELRADTYLEIGREGAVVSLLEPLVVEYPLRERLSQHLMVALYRSGRQADALGAYRRLADELAGIGLEASDESKVLEDRILTQDPTLLRLSPHAKSRPIHRLPRATTPFVGRESELGELQGLVSRYRLLTLAGIGGIGKSRLALELGHRVSKLMSAGDRYVDLSAVDDAEVATERIVEAFGLSEQAGRLAFDQIGELIGSEEAILVIDNAEEVAPHLERPVESLLAACPALHVIVTSRVPLRTRSEEVYVVGPLSLAPADDAPSDAVSLFLSRAHLTGPIGDQEKGEIAAICQQVNGIPAAIEVVAAAMKLLSVEEIADHLHDILAGDAREQRQSLPEVLRWTYEALPETQQALFRRLSIFTAGFTFDALRQVTDPTRDHREVLADVGHLIDRSLIARVGGRSSRYHLLEAFRPYASDWLEESGEKGAVRIRFVHYFVALAEELEGSFGTETWPSLLQRVDADAANAAHAIDLALDSGDVSSAYRIAGPLGRYWRWRGRCREGVGRVHAVLQHDGPGDPERAKVLREAAAIHLVLGNLVTARSLARDALALYERIGHDRGVADALYDLGMASISSGDFDTAQTTLQDAVAIWKRLDEPRLMAFPMIPLAWLRQARGEYAAAEALWTSILTNVDTAMFPEQSGVTFRVAELALAQGQVERAGSIAVEALEAARRAGYPYHEPGARMALGRVYYEAGDFTEARRQADQALQSALETGNIEGAALSLLLTFRLALTQDEIPEAVRLLQRFAQTAGNLGGPLSRAVLAEAAASLELARGNFREAASLYAAAERTRTSHRLSLGVLDEKQKDADMERLRAELGETFTDAYTTGSDSDEDAVEKMTSAWLT